MDLFEGHHEVIHTRGSVTFPPQPGHQWEVQVSSHGPEVLETAPKKQFLWAFRSFWEICKSEEDFHFMMER